jgi:hypothetical protein
MLKYMALTPGGQSSAKQEPQRVTAGIPRL